MSVDSRSDSRRRFTLATLGSSGLSVLPRAAGAQVSRPATSLRIAVVALEGDSRYRPRRTEKAYPGHPTSPALEGIRLGVSDSQYELDSERLKVDILHVKLAGESDLRPAMDRLRREATRVLALDLPAELLPVASSSAVRELGECLLFNTSLDNDSLRGSDCRAQLLHTYPSQAMLADAMAQYLAGRGWKSVLMLTGPTPADQLQQAAALRSAKRFGLRIVEQRPFKLTGNPSERDLGNTRLLTASRKADVVWVCDADGEFARTLPYATQQPRPVVGTSGLSPVAWHPQHDRYGALQLSRRFLRQTGRPMTGHDWAAWIAARSICAALVAQPGGSTSDLLKALRSGSLVLDGFKGRQLSFRAWDGQLRQPVLLSHGDGVVGFAPVEGVLHPVEVLDTLGVESQESKCR